MASNNKYALVTGGSRGIGLGISRSLAAEGFNLAVNGVRPELAVTEALEELSKFDIRLIYSH
jgi:3-oxoacyl-[acyl-carrier protein] reductase